MIRRILLWASTNRWMSEFLPRRPFVRRAVRSFMPGEERADALRAATGLQDEGIGVVFTLLGENVVSREGVDMVMAEYQQLLSAIAQSDLDAQLSVKLTQLGLDLAENVALDCVVRLAEQAGSEDRILWIDMEDSTYLEQSLRVYADAVKSVGASRIGICLQSYLRSSPGDLQTLLSLPPVVRLVKGAYAEAPSVAFPNRPEVDEAFFQLGSTLLDSAGTVAFATHDGALVQRLRDRIKEKPPIAGAYEFQMLYGIRSEEQIRLAKEGEPVRVLISYGPAWFPWYMRRLAERPANVWFVLKNLFRR